jgi:hypothetical protein
LVVKGSPPQANPESWSYRAMKYSNLIDMKDEEFRRMIEIKNNTFPEEVKKSL